MCEHLERFDSPRRKPVTPSAAGCEECLRTGGRWVHLRLCMTCGHVGCCDNSPDRHARRHFRDTRHEVIKSFEPGEDWAWCFADEEMAGAIPAFEAESPRRHHAPHPPGAGGASR